jgi:hypothetical protein
MTQAIARLLATAAATKKPTKPKALFKPGDIVRFKWNALDRGPGTVTVETPMYFSEGANTWGYGVRVFTVDGKLPKSLDKVLFAPADKVYKKG